MRVLIRDISRNLYLAPGGGWVERIADARHFALGAAAIEHIKGNALTGVELFCVFRNITFNTAIPVKAYEETISDLQKPEAKSEGVTPSSTDTSLFRKPKNIRVLLVEDDPDDVYMLETLLRKELSCEVSVAFTREIYETQLEPRPDVIISDSNVRAFDGFTALMLARRKYPDVPFIFCSGSMSPRKREIGLRLGATAWTSKENSFQELVKCVLRVLKPKDQNPAQKQGTGALPEI